MVKFKIILIKITTILAAICIMSFTSDSRALVSDKPSSNLISSKHQVNSQRTKYTIPAPNSLGQQKYIIQLKAPPVAGIKSKDRGIMMPKMANNKLDVNSTEVQSYLRFLIKGQNKLLSVIDKQLGRNVKPIHTFQFAYNGLVLSLTPEEAAKVEKHSDVQQVILNRIYSLDSDVGPQLIGADVLWGGMYDPNENPNPNGFLGEGIVIGTLDSGINFDHPSFSEVGGDGYAHINPLGDGKFLGVCDPRNEEQYIESYTCNNKLIGGYDFVPPANPESDEFEVLGPEDGDGHGSHVASTSGGNILTNVEALGVSGLAISGVAPHATHVIFDVCYDSGGCSAISSVAAVEQAIEDGLVDVINFSIAGGNSPWDDPVSTAFLNATNAGIVVSTSAGNAGPGLRTLSHIEPWTVSSGASTHFRKFYHTMSVTGPEPVPADLAEMFVFPGNGPEMEMDIESIMEYSGRISLENEEGCEAFPDDSFRGLIALIPRGSCFFEIKINHASEAGAIAVVIYNNEAGEPLTMDGLEDTTNIPSVMISESLGLALKDFVNANPGIATVQMHAAALISFDQTPDMIGSFSSRGPNPLAYNKPDVVAPGVGILAAYDDSDYVNDGTPAEYEVISGTSMASPHTTGSVALLRGLKPDWSVAEIKSALMLTATSSGIKKEDGTTPANPLDQGAGRIQVDVAEKTGLVLGESFFNFFNANPERGILDVSSLNIPSLTRYDCNESCSFQRRFRSVASKAVTYNASISGLPGSVKPSTFTINPGETITLDFKISSAKLSSGVYGFGQVLITPTVRSSFTSPQINIMSNGTYDGTLRNMICRKVDVSGINSAENVSVDLSIDHGNIGDLTVKLFNPDNDDVGLMSRPGFLDVGDDGTGCCGSKADLSATHPISFSDSSGNSAEKMGLRLRNLDTVCLTDGVCEFHPHQGSIIASASSLAEITTGTMDGLWKLCVGDSVGEFNGAFNSFKLYFHDAISDLPQLTMPIVVAGSAEVKVSPAVISQTQSANAVDSQALEITNKASASKNLNWAVIEGVKSIDYVNKNTISNLIFPSAHYTPTGAGVYLADDMVITSNATIDQLAFPGTTAGQSIGDIASAVEVRIYHNGENKPIGHPDDQRFNEVFKLNLDIDDPNLFFDDGTIVFDLKSALGRSPLITPGTYWVTVFPHLNEGFDLNESDAWYWHAGETSNDLDSKLIDPANLYGAGFIDWSDFKSVSNNEKFAGLAYSASGDVQCGADWLSVDRNTSDRRGIHVGGSNDLSVKFDSRGLVPANYRANLCIETNDPDNALIVVGVEMTVTP